MAKRTLTITQNPDWRSAIQVAGAKADAAAYQGETLNFESPAMLFKHLTELRWNLVTTLQAVGTSLGVRELARKVERDPSCVLADVNVLANLGLVERTEEGGVVCPYADIHLDMHSTRTAA